MVECWERSKTWITPCAVKSLPLWILRGVTGYAYFCLRKNLQKQEERKSVEETILTYAYIDFKNLTEQVIVHHFVANRGLKRTGHSVISHAVMLKNEIQKLFCSTSA